MTYGYLSVDLDLSSIAAILESSFLGVQAQGYLHILQVRHLPVVVFALGVGAGMLETQDWELQSSTQTEHRGSSASPTRVHMALCVSHPTWFDLRTGCLFSAKPFLRKMHAGPSRLCMTAQFWASTMSGPWYSQADDPSSLVWTALQLVFSSWRIFPANQQQANNTTEDVTSPSCSSEVLLNRLAET